GPLSNAADYRAARNVADQLTHEEHRCDETRDRERGAEVSGDRGDNRHDCTLAGGKEQCRQQRGERDRAPPEWAIGSGGHPSTLVRGATARRRWTTGRAGSRL